jgi:hypothetical protein
LRIFTFSGSGFKAGAELFSGVQSVITGALSPMRLSIRIEADVYVVALALARSQHISLGKAINQLARRGFERPASKSAPRKRRNGDFAVSAGKRLITPEDVDRIESDSPREP